MVAPVERFEEYVERTRGDLVGAIALFSGDPVLAEDMAQEALLRLWHCWETERMPERPEAWTIHTGMNLARSWYRRRQATARALARLGRPAATWTDPDAAGALTIREWVGRLTPRQRHVVVLRVYADLDIVQTSELMGCATGTVKALTHQALAQLKNFEQAEVDAPWTDA
jgi:RNA polymerase sigma factor (sigma-70 family)